MNDNVKTYFHRGWYLVLDKSEVFPDDPGQGTPAMVFSPDQNASATYNCALGEGEVTGDSNTIKIPVYVMDWLENLSDEIDTFLQW